MTLKLGKELSAVTPGPDAGVAGVTGGQGPTAKRPEPGWKGDILVGLMDAIHTQHQPERLHTSDSDLEKSLHLPMNLLMRERESR